LPSLPKDLLDIATKQKFHFQRAGPKALFRSHWPQSHWQSVQCSSQNRFLLAVQELTASQPKTEICFFIEVNEPLRLCWKKSTGRVLGFVCGSRAIKIGRKLFKQLKEYIHGLCNRPASKLMSISFSRRSTIRARSSWSKSNHSIAGGGFTWLGCTARQGATANPKQS
jgi:hypothetical protein